MKDVFICTNCGTNHTIKENLKTCGICKKLICTNCGTEVDFMDVVVQVFHNDNVYYADKTSQPMILCSECNSEVGKLVEKHNVELIELETMMQQKLRTLRRKYFEELKQKVEKIQNAKI